MAYITRTTGSSMTNQKIFTYSAWLKIGDLDSYIRPIQNYYDSNNRGYILLNASADTSDNMFFFYDVEGGTTNYNGTTIAKFRDTNAWYHLVYRVDTTQSSQSDRVRIYINGEQQSMNISTNVGQNTNMGFNSGGANLRIGGTESGTQTWKGLMSHVHFCDGYSYGPDSFGSTDSTTGEWKINTNPSVTYGNNGFFVFKDDASVTDRSGEGNNFTSSGTIAPTQDSPSNIFCTLNPLANNNSTLNFTNGNTTMSTSSQWLGTTGTLGMFKGKFYWEFKGSGNFMLGVSQLNSDAVETVNMSNANNGYSSKWSTGWEMINGGNKANNNSSSTSYGSSYSSSDIGMVAFDADNGILWFGKNGAWQNSATQTEVENGTDTNAAWTGLTNSNGYIPTISVENSTMDMNFGNGYFGTTAISSEGINASGIGKFEYNVPSGYTALSTKGLNL
jgi:hypothetical protein